MSVALARKFRIDVNADATIAPTVSTGWLQFNGVTDWDPAVTPNLVDVMAYDTNGLPSQEVTAYDGVMTATVLRRLISSVYDPGQEVVRLASSLQFGQAARVGLRWYDKNGGPETGYCAAIPTWKRSQTGVKDAESVTCTFQATDGVLQLNYANPGTAATVPTVVSASPSGQGAGKILTLIGSGFLGTTGITVGGVAVATGAFSVQSDNEINLVMPAGTAGSAPVIVTNAIGAGASFPYTRTT